MACKALPCLGTPRNIVVSSEIIKCVALNSHMCINLWSNTSWPRISLLGKVQLPREDGWTEDGPEAGTGQVSLPSGSKVIGGAAPSYGSHGGSWAPPASLLSTLGFPCPVLGFTAISHPGRALSHQCFLLRTTHNSHPSQIWERLDSFRSTGRGTTLRLEFARVLRSVLFSCESSE